VTIEQGEEKIVVDTTTIRTTVETTTITNAIGGGTTQEMMTTMIMIEMIDDSVERVRNMDLIIITIVVNEMRGTEGMIAEGNEVAITTTMMSVEEVGVAITVVETTTTKSEVGTEVGNEIVGTAMMIPGDKLLSLRLPS
jgi:hypothetical protein